MAVGNHYLIESSSDSVIIRAALSELVAQQARVVATKAATGSSHEVKRAVSTLNRIVEVHGTS